jgi:hypothetical protein
MQTFDDILAAFESDTAPVKEKRQSVQAKPGTTLGILYSVVDCGTVKKQDQKDPSKSYDERNLRLSFELPMQIELFDGVKKPLSQHEGFVRYQSTPGQLMKVNNKTGKAKPTLTGYAAAMLPELPPALNPAQLIGKACQLTISPDVKKDGTPTVYVSAANPVMEGIVVPAMFNKPFVYSVQFHGFESDAFKALPRFLRKGLTETVEFAQFKDENQQAAAAIVAETQQD